MTARPLALFRCDASPAIGAGHVSRCLALAETFGEAGWRIDFVVGADTLATAPALMTSGYPVRTLTENESDAAVLAEEADEGAALLVVDHYGRDATFEKECRAFAHKVLAFDDMTGRQHDCDILVDAAAPGALSYTTHVPAAASVLTGAAYALTRKSFLAARADALSRRDGRPVRNILVSCGATDPANATAVVLDVLKEAAPDIAVTAVLSSKAPHADVIRTRARGRMQLILDADNMAELMSKADIAIGAPGTTAFDRATLGLPSILITLAENQRGVARSLIKAGAALDAGELNDGFAHRLRDHLTALLGDGALRVRLAGAASRFVDGRGAMRILLACLDAATSKSGGVRMRMAAAADEAWLLDLQRQPCTRRYFRNPAVPSAEEHHRWMQATLSNPERLLFIIEVEGQAAGMIRLDRLADKRGTTHHEIAVAVDPQCNGLGIGTAALGFLRKLMPGATFDARILPGNARSLALFKRAGFAPLSNDLYRSVPA